MDNAELLRQITELTKKDMECISFKKGSKDYTWSIKMEAPVSAWKDLIARIAWFDSRLRALIGDPESCTPASLPVATGEEGIIRIEISKYAAGNYGWEISVSPNSFDLVAQCQQELETKFNA